MLEIENKPSKNRFQIDTEDSPVKAVIEFLDTHLPNFPAAFKQMTSTTQVDAEDDISQLLWEYLQSLAHSKEVFMFQFQRKYLKSRRSSDLAVLSVEHHNKLELRKAFFYIEAKRLPTGSGREKEYVEGNYGGIERYKRGHHGGNVIESAMIGYIQDINSPSYWQQEINKWISDLTNTNSLTDICWDSDDSLILEVDLLTAVKYKSKNTRIVSSVKDSIRLHHYLMELS